MIQDDKLRISTVCREKDYKTHPHFHRHNELYYLDEGKSRMFVSGKMYSLREGNLVFIKSGCIHKTSAGDNNSHTRTVLMFPDDILVDIRAAVSDKLDIDTVNSMVIHIPKFMQNSFKQKLRSIEREISDPDGVSDIMLKYRIGVIIIEMLRKYTKKTYDYRHIEDTMDPIISMAIDYIGKNYTEPITLISTANHINMSPTYFSKKFKHETGMGYKEYICKLRLREAEKLLRSDPKMSVNEIAGKCGFSDSNYFSTAFRHSYGISPNQFRRLADEY